MIREHTAGRRGADRLDYRPYRTLRAPLEADGPSCATRVVGEYTGVGTLRMQGSPGLPVTVMCCRMVVVGNSGMVVHFVISSRGASHLLTKRCTCVVCVCVCVCACGCVCVCVCVVAGAGGYQPEIRSLPVRCVAPSRKII
jgi:hypothetical protein